MATSLAAQLSQIAAKSTNTLNLKAQKVAHSKSLIFEPRVAASQNFDSLHTLCYEGYKELCLLDDRFTPFQRSLFSEGSRDQDRTQMTAAQNEELDRRIEEFLSKVGSKLQISPAVKAVEWLVRRFRIHEYNTSFLLMTFLPYHSLPIFVTLLSILPKNLPPTFRFLHPYIRSLKAPPRRAIVLHIAHNVDFMTAFNGFMLGAARNYDDYPILTTFWAGLSTEAVNIMMDKARSGRRGVQVENEQTVILCLLPMLNEGLHLKKSTDLRLGCYMLLTLLATKGALNDKLISAMMEAVVLGWTKNTFVPGIVCLAILAQQRSAKKLPRRIARELMKVPDIEKILFTVSERRRIDKLANGFLLSLVDRFGKHGDPAALVMISPILNGSLVTENQATVVLKSMLLLAHMHEDKTDESALIRTRLADFLTNLVGERSTAAMSLQKALVDSGIDVDQLELKLNVTLRSTKPQLESNTDSAAAQLVDSEQVFYPTLPESLHAELSTYNMDERSFLSQATSPIYKATCVAFLASIDNPNLLSTFESAPVLHQDTATDDPRYFSFFMRIMVSAMPVLARAAALNIIARRLEELTTSSVDFQALIPFCICGLADPAAKVRQAAANVLSILVSEKDFRSGEAPTHTWGKDNIYGEGQASQKLVWMSSESAQRLLHDVLGPSLEECVLDRDYIIHLMETTINSGSKSIEDSLHRTGSMVQLRQAARASILSFVTSHTINIPLYTVKLRMLNILSHVRGVASTTKTKLLLPLLQEWSDLGNDVALQLATAEHISINDLDDAMVSIVSPLDLTGLEQLSTITSEDVGRRRRSLTEAAFRRFAKIWASMKGASQTSTARHFLRLALFVQDCPAYVQESAADLLKNVTLSTETLSEFITMLPTSADMANRASTTKRRRTSHGEVATSSVQDPEELMHTVRQVTFVLQLIDSSDLRAHIPLLKNLFHILFDLQRLKHQVASELGYLQGLVLSSLLSILDAIKSDRSLVLDRSSVRADLLVDCIQKTSSPQVQNTALLLIARLAHIAPDLVLHSVMPVFTFMGTSVLRQNDDYSAHVIKQTIDEVIPPLIDSLRRERQNPVLGATELLLSFVAAYEHVPHHRRLDLFQSLVKVLGPDDFLFAVIAMLSDKYGANADIKHFSSDLVGIFSVECQLVGVVKYLELVTDALAAKPVLSTALLGLNTSVARDQHHLVFNLLSLLPYILSRTELVRSIGKILRKDDMQSSRVRELYSTSLEFLLSIADTARSDTSLHSACGDVLQSLLGLLATDEFVKSVEGLLDKPDRALRRKILRSLEVRVDQEGQINTMARQAMLGFLPQLTSIIRESDDDQYKHTAVSCIDKIAEKYGKKDLEAVAAAAQVIAGDHCLGQPEPRLRVAALLCLASLTDTLREAMVPILPTAIPMALDYMLLKRSDGSIDLTQHTAALSFISSLAQHLPYMLSGSYLTRLLKLSNLSAAADLGAEAEESRAACLRLVTKQVDANVLFPVLEQSWTETVDAGILALREYLDLLSLGIEKHSKSVVTRNSSMLSSIFLKAFDLRRYSSQLTQPFDAEDLEDAEVKINAAAIKMIYKFNDQTFRPIFAELVDWSASGVSRSDVKARTLRMQSVYSFMSAFFGNLKSIVTSYAAYILENAAEVLLKVDIQDDDSKELWTRVLHTLTECFEHDQDEFWQSQSHFNIMATALDSQFKHGTSLPLQAELVPAIVELAAAADSAEHHKQLNTNILKHMRSERASVRLAAVLCEQALTDRLGEEWLSMLPEMLPFISELQEDDDEVVERETHKWIVKIEGVLGESLDAMLQ